jgi:hypothetical protein
MNHIYAELNKKQYNSIQNGEAFIQVPKGVKVKFNRTARYISFICPDENLYDLVMSSLKKEGISCQ